MKNMFIPPAGEYTRFNNDEEAIVKLKEWKLLTPKAISVKKFLYKGIGVEKATTCEVIGFTYSFEAVIKLETGEIHSIHVAYLREMQKTGFLRDTSVEEEMPEEQ